MIEIFLNNDLLYSQRMQEAGYALLACKLTTGTNKAGSLEFTLPPTNPCYTKIKKLRSTLIFKEDGKVKWRGRCLDTTLKINGFMDVYCEGTLAYFNDFSTPSWEGTKDETVQAFLTRVLKEYNDFCDADRKITLGEVYIPEGVEATLHTTLSDPENMLAVVNECILEQIGGYFVMTCDDTNDYINYYNLPKEKCDQQITFGVNMRDLEYYIDATDIYTYMIPLADADIDQKRLTVESVNGGKNYIYNEAAASLFGKIMRTVIFDNITDAKTLLSSAQTELETVITENITITVDAVDLSLEDEEIKNFEVGKSVRIVSNPHGLDTELVCSKIVYDVISPWNTQITLGKEKDVISADTAETARTSSITSSTTSKVIQSSIPTNYAKREWVEEIEENLDELWQYCHNTLYGTHITWCVSAINNILMTLHNDTNPNHTDIDGRHVGGHLSEIYAQLYQVERDIEDLNSRIDSGGEEG